MVVGGEPIRLRERAITLCSNGKRDCYAEPCGVFLLVARIHGGKMRFGNRFSFRVLAHGGVVAFGAVVSQAGI